MTEFINPKDMVPGRVYKKQYGKVKFQVNFKPRDDWGPYRARRLDNDKIVYVNLYDNLVDVTEEIEMNKLYEFELDGKTVYGSYLATDSSNKWVMEVRGSNQVVTIDKKEVREVIPYTISVCSLSNEKAFDVRAEKDKYKVGEIYLCKTENKGMGLLAILKLDTKSKTATKEFNPVSKVVVEGV